LEPLSLPLKKKKTSKTRNNTIRIIGGEWRGRKLTVPALDGLRPTGDRVRETLFNWLSAEVVGARCLDLFAGTGALGLEALSRGAAHCVFVDAAAVATRQLQDNLTLLQCDRARICTADGLRQLERETGPFDIVFLDPPFALQLWQGALSALTHEELLSHEALVYVEQPRSQQLEFVFPWQLHREKLAGDVRYGLYRWATRHDF